MVTRNMLCTHGGKVVFSVKKPQFVTALDLITCLKQIKKQKLLLTCAPLSKLPSDISTMPTPKLF